jgi:LCP family protein required for cell wall assembly
MMNDKRPKSIRLLTTFALAAAVVLIALYSVYMIWERPPEEEESPLGAKSFAPPAETPAQEASPEPTPAASEEPGGVYTLLLVGNDDGNGNTDTILLCRLDTAAHTLHAVNIPRDTLINADWQLRKINAVYWTDRLQGGNGIDALKRHIRMLCGFEPDNYAVLDLKDLVTAVDLLGGVDFDVPRAMHYDDPTQDLHIHLDEGPQHLSGEKVMWLCRYRSGYPSGDLGRIEMQQSFLRACVEQFAVLGKVPNLLKAASYLAGELDTDMTAANMIWYVRQALACRGEGLRFETLPTASATVHGYSYAVVRLWEWLAMLNESLAPAGQEFTPSDLDLVYSGETGYAGTQGLRGSWYYRWTPPAAAPAPTPAPTPVPTPEPSAGPNIITVVPGGSEAPEEAGPPPDSAPDEPEPSPTPGDDWIAAAFTP